MEEWHPFVSTIFMALSFASRWAHIGIHTEALIPLLLLL